MRIYHNFVRPHMALDAATPAEKAGIAVKGKDKWLTLIQKAESHNLKCCNERAHIVDSRKNLFTEQEGLSL